MYWLRRGYSWASCSMLAYSQVILDSRRPDLALAPDEVISRGLRRHPHPAKTTRHLLRGGVECRCDIALAELQHAVGACPTRTTAAP
ncbi:hypothetical protein [Burkholderia ubonensis]|uniref:hypothetical protein n=1 Tax=Burkholderia ubonensis TaxID=101571 RepID=UPI000ACD6966|nr:hypothetical protein [Burkholderia ubonensis]